MYSFSVGKRWLSRAADIHKVQVFDYLVSINIEFGQLGPELQENITRKYSDTERLLLLF